MPGAAVTVPVRIRNIGSQPDEYAVRVIAAPQEWDPGWARVVGGVLRLAPRTETTVNVRILVPRQLAAVPGPDVLEVEVGSYRQPRVRARARIDLDVLPYTDFSVAADPPVRHARRRGEFAVTVTNTGTAPVRVELASFTENRKADATCGPSVVDVPVRGQATALVHATARKRRWFRMPLPHPIRVTAHPVQAGPGRGERTAAAVFVQTSLVPRLLTRLLLRILFRLSLRSDRALAQVGVASARGAEAAARGAARGGASVGASTGAVATVPISLAAVATALTVVLSAGATAWATGLVPTGTGRGAPVGQSAARGNPVLAGGTSSGTPSGSSSGATSPGTTTAPPGTPTQQPGSPTATTPTGTATPGTTPPPGAPTSPGATTGPTGGGGPVGAPGGGPGGVPTTPGGGTSPSSPSVPPPPGAVTVPSIAGLSATDGEGVLRQAGLGVVEQRSDSTLPIGQVVGTSPSGGSSVPPGTTIAVTVSDGEPLPGCTLTLSDCEQRLAAYSVSVVRQYSTNTAAGYVISLSPSEGTQVSVGSAVTIYVSIGPPLVTVPNVVTNANGAYYSYAQAQSALAAVGLGISGAAGCSGDYIVGQSPAAGSSVPVGSVVNVDDQCLIQ